MKAENTEFKSQRCYQQSDLSDILVALGLILQTDTHTLTHSLMLSEGNRFFMTNNEIMHAKCWIQYLAYYEYSISISFKKYHTFLEHLQCARCNLGNKTKRSCFFVVFFFVTSCSLRDCSSPNEHRVLTTGQTGNSRRGPILKKECINKNQYAYYTNAKAVQKMNLETCLETDSFLQEESFGSRLLKG